MNGNDRKKLLASGHQVMRANEHNLSITKLLPTGGWGIVEKFPNKAALKRGISWYREESDKTVFEFELEEETTPDENQLTLIMTREEAEKKHAQLKSLTTVIRALFFEMRDRRGWQALGYSSFEQYGKEEFGYSSSHIYRLASAFEVEKSINSPTGEIPETHLRPLAPLTEEERQKIWAEATKQADENRKKITAKQIEELIIKHKQAENDLLENNNYLAESLKQQEKETNQLRDNINTHADKIANEKLDREKQAMQANMDQIATQLESDYAARVDSQSDVILRLKNELALLKESQSTNSPALSASETGPLEEKIQALNDDIARLTQIKNDSLKLQNINSQYKHYAKHVITNMNELIGIIDGFTSVNNDAEFEGIKAYQLLDDETKRLLKEAIFTLGYTKGKFLYMLTNSTADNFSQQLIEPAKPEIKKINRIKLEKPSLDELRKLANAPIVTSYINPGIIHKLNSHGLIEFVMLPSPFKSHKGIEIQHVKITRFGIDYLSTVIE